MWSNYGLSPIPPDAPAFVPLGGAHVPMRIVPYLDAMATTVDIDDRWAIDTTHVTGTVCAHLARGDIVVFVGKRGRLWWSPAPVIRTRRRRGGIVEVATLRDLSLEQLSSDDIDELDSELVTDAFVNPTDLADDVKRAVRDLWGLDVWCPRCGAIGNPILWGMPSDDPNQLTDQDGNLRAWPAGSFLVAGCAVSVAQAAYNCPRCNCQWGGPAAALERQGIALTFADLLRQMGCADLDQFHDELDNYSDLDVFIDFEDSDEPDLGFFVGIGRHAAGLLLPPTCTRSTENARPSRRTADQALGPTGARRRRGGRRDATAR